MYHRTRVLLGSASSCASAEDVYKVELEAVKLVVADECWASMIPSARPVLLEGEVKGALLAITIIM